MFKEFFTREISMAIKRPMVWIFFTLVAFFTTLAVASDNVIIGGSTGNLYKNAPHILASYSTVWSLLGLLFAAAFFNNAALKDHNNKFNEILFSTPLSKAGYFWGRFVSAWVLSVIPLLGIFVGFIIGPLLGAGLEWTDADRYGPTPYAGFLNCLVLFLLPNMFIAGAVIFSIANKWRSTVISFVGALLIIITYSIAGQLVSDIDNEMVAGVVDMFGIRSYGIDSKYTTTMEKNTIGASFTPLLVMSRIIWMGLSALILAFSYWTFSFAEKRKKVKAPKQVEQTSSAAVLKLPYFSINFDRSTSWAQFKSFFTLNYYSITRSVTYKTLFLFSFIMLVTSFWGGFEYFGLQSYPVTYKMMDSLGVIGIFEFIVLVFFSGELVWRDRGAKINGVIDATPHNSVVSAVAKILSLIATVASIRLFAIVIAILYQLINGYTKLELGIYVQDFLYGNLAGFIFWAMFLVFVQTVINNKYIGYFVSFIIIFFQDIIFFILEWRSYLVQLGSTPGYTYSDMNSFGPSITSVHWFNTYWILAGLVLTGLTGLLWVRGTTTELGKRVQIIKKHFNPTYKISMGIILLLWLSTTGFVYYNTQVLNTYDNSDDVEQSRADYEKQYKQYQGIVQPKITDVIYNIDIFPEDRNVITNSRVTLNNKSHTPIDSLHFIINDDWDMKLSIPNSELVYEDEDAGYLIYKLNEPMQAHASIVMNVEAANITKGFENDPGNTSVVKNGTFFNNMNVLPNIGYQESFELSDKYTRKKYDLEPKEQMPKLESPCSDHCMSNYLSSGGSDWVSVETFISTSGDQLAIAPGSLQKEWQEDGRNHYHYKVDRPSQNFYSFISARYEVARKKWKDVDIEVYYDQQHAYNVELMLDAVESSLEYYTENFGPYYHKQARIIEFPRYSTFAQAFPGTMPYSESFGFIINLEDKSDNNVINAVIAHEMAHQWWAHQVIGSAMEGSTMLSESFAEYSSLMVMKNELNDDLKMKKFLKYDFDRYLRGRSSETRKETPLYKVQNQGYIHYGKGAVILYALQDYIGEDSLNQALQGFLEAYRYQEPPYPTSMDFFEYLEPRIPDSLSYLVDDWFKNITLYDYRLKTANTKQLDNGQYETTIDIEAYKMHVDSIGNEKQIAFKDWVDVGLYADAEEEELLTVERVLFDKEKMQFTILSEQAPAKAAIDPKRLLIERNIDDNVKAVELQ